MHAITWIDPPITFGVDHPDHTHPAFRAWQAHVDAGRIGTRLPPSPEIAADRAHTEALFRARAAARRAARA